MNRKFRYVITDLFNGCVVGTETGSWITGEEPLEIEEYKE